jgi:hypothetical protein
VGGLLAGAGKRKRRDCGKVERLFLGSSDVERAHNLLNGVALGSGEAEELSQT